MSDSQVDLMRALHDEHAASLWGYCLRLTGGDHARAQDVVQETLLRAWRHPSVLGPVATVGALVAVHGGPQRRHRRLAHPPLPARAVDRRRARGRPRDQTDELLQSWMVADALSHLSEDHRQVLVECYYRGRSVADAAQRLGVPVGTVKSRTHYALRALRLALEEMGVES